MLSSQSIAHRSRSLIAVDRSSQSIAHRSRSLIAVDRSSQSIAHRSRSLITVDRSSQSIAHHSRSLITVDRSSQSIAHHSRSLIAVDRLIFLYTTLFIYVLLLITCKIIKNPGELKLAYGLPDNSNLIRVSVKIYVDGELKKTLDFGRGEAMRESIDIMGASGYTIDYKVILPKNESGYIYMLPKS
ncbi:MAG: hypothetical protein ACM65L_25595 [Microcoleus sp.]